MLRNYQSMKQIAAVFAILFPCLCFAVPEHIVSTTLCELASNPDAFNHKLVKLSGDVTHGYRLFTLAATCKPNLSSIWLSYGGLINPPALFNSQQGNARSQRLVVEGIPPHWWTMHYLKNLTRQLPLWRTGPRYRLRLLGDISLGTQNKWENLNYGRASAPWTAVLYL